MVDKNRSKCRNAKTKTEGMPDFIGGNEICTVNYVCLKCGKPCYIKKDDKCSFCWEIRNKKSAIRNQPFRVLFETKYFMIKFSLFPVTPRHLLVIPKRHFAKATDMDFDELQDFQLCRKKIEDWYHDEGITAWNSGDNYGRIAGQSIAHFHYHYFDRKKGDVKNSRGGIRNFMPPLEELSDYKDET